MPSNDPTLKARPALVHAKQVRVATTCQHVPVPSTDEPNGCQVRLIKDGDTVQAIEVTCPCGQRIHLVCEYDSSAT